MKYLRQYIRQILSEGAKSWNAFPEDVAIVIKHYDYGDGLEGAYIYYAVIDSDTGEPHEIKPFQDRINDVNGERIYGRIDIQKPEDYGPCGGAMKVENSRASSGWGPLLYDVAIEWATQSAEGLMADRSEVSSDARKVWDFYLNSRSDVQAHQLDDKNNWLTLEDEDNCQQEIEGTGGTAVDMVDSNDDTWVESSLSKRYTKPPTTINALKAAGKLVEL